MYVMSGFRLTIWNVNAGAGGVGGFGGAVLD